MSLIKSPEHQMTNPEQIDLVVDKMLKLPQAECSVKHYLGAGVYIREVTVQGGVFSIGHYQNFEQMNILVEGRVIMLENDGTTKELSASHIPFTYREGNKVGYIVEKMIWQNIYPNPDDETDLDVLEAKFITKNKIWEKDTEEKNILDRLKREVDRLDYEKMLTDLGVTHDQVLTESEEENNQIPFPVGTHSIKASESNIQGKGLFALSPIKKNDVIAASRLNGMRTPAGRYTNHSVSPNAKVVKVGGDLYLTATKDISGCHGGDQGEEITLDYRQVNLVVRMDL